MVDLGNALSGALAGAGLGSAGGGIGTALGAAAGGIGGLFGLGKGKKTKLKNYNPYTPQQQQFQGQALQGAQNLTPSVFDYLQQILSNDPEAFEDFERPYQEQFQEQTVPFLLDRFLGGQEKGSGSLNLALAQAGRQLSGDLSTQRAKLRESAINQLNNYANVGLNKQNTPYVQQGTQGVFDQANQQYGGQTVQNLLQKYGAANPLQQTGYTPGLQGLQGGR